MKILNLAQSYFQETVAPQADLLDREPEVLKTAIQEMGDRNLLALLKQEYLPLMEITLTTLAKSLQ